EAGRLMVKHSSLRRNKLRSRKSQALAHRLQGTESAQRQVENALLNSGIVQHFHGLPASHADAHLFAGREGDRVDAHCVEMIDALFGGEEIFLFGVAEPEWAQAESIHA